MIPDVGAHKFNDDLLLGEPDRYWARERFAAFFHVLDDPELRALFLRHDAPAKAAKARSRALGLLAIAMLALTLLGTSSAALWAVPNSAWTQAIEFCSALFGMGGFAIGWWGALRGRRKRDWLFRRVMTERLRQLHFQALVRRLAPIAASLDGGNPAAKGVYQEQRRSWLSSFEHDHDGRLDAMFAALTSESSESRTWLHPPASVSDQELVALERAGLFDAYRDLRIQHQLQYADYQLRTRGPAPLRAVRTQHALLDTIWLAALCVTIALHLAAAIGALIGWLQPLPLLEGPFIHVASMWLLIVAISMRTIQGGLATGPEIERYLGYRTALLSIRDRFDQAPGPRERLPIMEEMERLAFTEMLAFLRSHDEALFCL